MAVSRQRRGKRRARRRGDSNRLALGNRLTIVEARAWQRSLHASLERSRAELDARALTSVDTAGLQLLLAAGRAAREHGLSLRVLGARSLLFEAAISLGLGSALTEVVELIP